MGCSCRNACTTLIKSVVIDLFFDSTIFRFNFGTVLTLWYFFYFVYTVLYCFCLLYFCLFLFGFLCFIFCFWFLFVLFCFVLFFFLFCLFVFWFCILYYKKSHEHSKKIWRYQRGNLKIRKSKKGGQHNDQKKKNKRTNNDLQNIYIQLKID